MSLKIVSYKETPQMLKRKNCFMYTKSDFQKKSVLIFFMTEQTTIFEYYFGDMAL